VAKTQANQSFDPDRGPVLSARFAIAIVLVVLGLAWIVYYYVGVRPEGEISDAGEVLGAKGPVFLRDLGDWNYLIGFGALFLGLIVSAHPSTPLGRGRGVVAGMLGCFLVGLAWICVFYAIANDTSAVPIFDDLGQKNLMVGIGFMAVGFTFATRWE
jgi:drug/metabolite transporter (DMT)-like permease